jgi:hypothetical protein
MLSELDTALQQVADLADEQLEQVVADVGQQNNSNINHQTLLIKPGTSSKISSSKAKRSKRKGMILLNSIFRI